MKYFLFVINTKYGMTHRIIQANTMVEAKALLSAQVDKTQLDYNVIAFETTAPIWRTCLHTV